MYFQLSEQKNSDHSNKYILPSLAIARFAITPPGIVSGLLLVDIAATFNRSVAVMAQMRTTANTLSMVAALIMAVLSVKYRHRSLALTGLLLVTVSGIGCFCHYRGYI